MKLCGLEPQRNFAALRLHSGPQNPAAAFLGVELLMVDQDPRLIALQRINLSTARVEFNDSHIVLLCGGPVPLKEHADAPDPPISSLRHAITASHPSFEIFRPEEITDWHADGLFKNLMSFEQELAGICSLIVVILESAGSIAELGAFSQLSDLSSKMIAIKSHDFETEKNVISFINLGILRFLREGKESAVRTYPWSISPPFSIETTTLQDVVTDIEATVAELPKSASFNSSLSTHKAALLCELVSLFAAVKESEFLAYFEHLAVGITRDELRRKLFLLKRFRLLQEKTYSDATFYVAGQYPFHHLRLGSKDDARIDAARISTECLNFYKSDNKQRHRHRVLTRTG